MMVASNITPYEKMPCITGSHALVRSIRSSRCRSIHYTPQVVQTTVVRETHIPDATLVTRVVREDGGIYAVTVRQNDATRVVYVNEAGAIVDSPTSTVTTTTTTEPAEQEVITYEQAKQNLP